MKKKLLKEVMCCLLCMGIVAFPKMSIQAAEDEYIGADALADNNTEAPTSWGALPTPEQYRYQKEELSAFVHFGPNTFNEIEWGQSYGDKTPDEIFTLEEAFDATTLVESIKAAGFKKIIVTAKHHDGFVIWNSAYTDYDVAATSYKDGKGDILAEISAACTKADIDMGLYLSPWDIHAPEYGYYDAAGNATTADKDVLDYNDYYVNQLNEILGDDKYGNDGHFSEIWMDGAKGSGENAQAYDFIRWYETIQNQEGIPAGFDSECMIFQCGANTTVRWIGNENGYASKNTWSKSMVNIDANTCDDNLQGSYSLGYENGNKWTVPEADARITSGWFWGTKKKTPKSLIELGNMYFGSVGNNAPLLLNIPPNNQGKVDQEILDRVGEFGDNVRDTFDDNLAMNEEASVMASSVRGNDIAYSPMNVVDGDDASYWTTDDGINTGSLLVDLGGTKVFDVVSIEEAIQFGQSINEYKIEYRNGASDTWKVIDEGKTIGAKRLARTSPLRGDQVRITVSTNKTDALPIISEVGVYKASEGFQLGGLAPLGMDVISVKDTNISDGAGFTFSGKWNPESGPSYIDNSNTWANAGVSTTVTFHGSKIYLVGTKDPNHGTATIRIDGGAPITIDTSSTARSTGQIIYTSEDLADGDHTLTLTVDTKAIGIEAAYVINNDGMGMIGLEQNAYTMNEAERMEVKVVRVGGSKGDIKATLQPNPGSAIQDDYNTELIPEIILKDGEKEVMVPVETKRNTNETGDRSFSIEISDPSENLIVGFIGKAEITIKDSELSSIESLNSLVEEALKNKKDWFISGWDTFESALKNAEAVLDMPQPTIAEIETAIKDLSKAMDALEKREQYSENDRFEFPWKKGSSALLESEFSIIDNDTSNDGGWPCVVVEGDWASNGKFIDALNQNDKLRVYYTAEKPGTYHAVLSYQSGATANAVAWSDESGKIESGSASAGASKVGTTYTAEFDFIVKEAGDGVLVFTGPAGKSPRMDSIMITPSDVALSEYTITASATAGGEISDAGENILTEGDSKAFVITPSEGYLLKDVLVNGASVGAITAYTVENISEDVSIEAIFELVNYTASNRFIFPSDNTTATLEAEYSIIVNDTSNDGGYPCTVVGGSGASWASNGKFIDALNQNDKLRVYYTADRPGTYHAVLSYQSGATVNAVTWSEESGKIENGSASAGASKVGTTYTAEFDFVVKEAGDGVLVFTGPAGKSPRMDKLDITYVELNKAALEKLIQDAAAIEPENYTESSVAQLNTALTAARDALTNATTQVAIDTATSALQTAIDGLVAKAIEVDKSNLEQLMSEVTALDENSYTGNSWKELQDQIVVAQAVLDNVDASQAEVDIAVSELQATKDALVTKADKSVLDTLIADADTKVEETYTAASWGVFESALADAKAISADDNATQEQVNNAAEALSDAMNALETVQEEAVNTDDLQQLISESEALIEEAYTADSWVVLAEALTSAKEVLANPEATQADVDAATAQLQAAKDTLVVVQGEDVNTEALQQLIKASEALIEEAYTTESWAVLAEALASAKTVLANPEATQAEVDAATAQLQAAKDALVAVQGETVDTEALQQLIKEIEALDANDYTTVSWKQLQAVLAEAKEVLANPEATQADIDAQVKALQVAKDKLVKQVTVIEKPSTAPTAPAVSGNGGSTNTGDTTNVNFLYAILLLSGVVVVRRYWKKKQG